MTFPFKLEVGDTTPTDILGDTYSISVRRGLSEQGLTDELDPASFTAVVKGKTSTNPLTNVDARPNQRVRLLAAVDAGSSTTWEPVFTGKLQRGLIEYDPDKTGAIDVYRITLTGTDLVERLTATPSEVAVSGTLTQRVAAVLDPTGLPYVVVDTDPATTSVALPTKGKTVVDQLRLIRDTLHALMFIDRDGALRAVADGTRARAVTAPDHVASDATVGAIHYTDLAPAFDTDELVNVLTIETLTVEDEPVQETFTDDASASAWGEKPQTVVVNDGNAETHAGLFLATRTAPALRPERFRFVVDDRHPGHLTSAATMEIGDTVLVERAGIPSLLMGVHDLTHTITPQRWSVEVGVRVPEVLATRWDDVPADLTWDDVPADLTWNDAIDWHPYLGV